MASPSDTPPPNTVIRRMWPTARPDDGAAPSSSSSPRPTHVLRRRHPGWRFSRSRPSPSDSPPRWSAGSGIVARRGSRMLRWRLEGSGEFGSVDAPPAAVGMPPAWEFRRGRAYIRRLRGLVRLPSFSGEVSSAVSSASASASPSTSLAFSVALCASRLPRMTVGELAVDKGAPSKDAEPGVRGAGMPF